MKIKKLSAQFLIFLLLLQMRYTSTASMKAFKELFIQGKWYFVQTFYMPVGSVFGPIAGNTTLTM